jgi:hypothetical protein
MTFVFGKRLDKSCGYVLLIAALIKHTRGSNKLGLDFAWSWLATMLNIKRSSVHLGVPGILWAFLDSIGQDMYNRYGRQFLKLLRFILDKLLPAILPECEAETCKLRLKLLLRDKWKIT